MTMADRARANDLHALRNATGIVIPVYFPPRADPALAERLLRETARAWRREVPDGQALCLSVDGGGAAEEAARSVAHELGAQIVGSERNRGKLSAVRSGMRRLLADGAHRYVAVVDQDGDHFANELPNFLRAARHVERSAKTEQVMVLGRRISRHRPMGLFRGELEELADRMLLDALQYDAAVTGQPLRLQFAATLDQFPDFHSGYKLFTRATAEEVFLAEPQLAGASEDGYFRHAVEAVMVVEAIKSGAWLAAVNRSTLDEQPVSAFAELDRRQMIADKIVWPCKRLGVPADFVAQWLRNHLPRLLLGTLVPEGREELLAIRRLVLAAFGRSPADEDAEIARPRFI